MAAARPKRGVLTAGVWRRPAELDVDETHLADHKRAEVKVFKQGQTTTTVSVVPLKAESEDRWARRRGQLELGC
jgi:hypothetical protein